MIPQKTLLKWFLQQWLNIFTFFKFFNLIFFQILKNEIYLCFRFFELNKWNWNLKIFHCLKITFPTMKNHNSIMFESLRILGIDFQRLFTFNLLTLRKSWFFNLLIVLTKILYQVFSLKELYSRRLYDSGSFYLKLQLHVKNIFLMRVKELWYFNYSDNSSDLILFSIVYS